MQNHSLNLVGSCFVVLSSMALGCANNTAAAGGGEGGTATGGGATTNNSTSAAGGSTASTSESTSGGATTERGGSGNGGSSASSNPTNGGANSTQVTGTSRGGAAQGGAAQGGAESTPGGRSGSRAGASTGGNLNRGGAATGGVASDVGGRGSGRAGAATGGATSRGGAATGGSTAATAGNTGTNGDPVKSEGCGKTPTLKSGNGQKIDVSGTSRNYNLKLPDNYDNNHPYRLIMSYHWLGGTANDVSNGGVAKPYYGLWDLAQGSTIFVAPDGTPNTNGSGNQWANSNGSDVEFSRQLINLMESEFCIDKSRIFCEGFSMGGSMSYAMACGMGDVVRAVAVHSGGTMSGCAKHDKPVAYFMTHGTNDSVCKYPSFPMPPLADFAKLNGCTSPNPSAGNDQLAASLAQPTDSSGKTPACTDFTGCKDGYPVRACLFIGDHTPSPGGTSGWVPTESWKFLSQF